VHVVPRARASGVVGRHGDAVKIRVAAPPADGAANAELVRLVADRLGVAPARVIVTAGAAGRRKHLSVSGLDSSEIRSRLLDGPPAPKAARD
jgi:uncharacterized protein (TIGR00251 family)